MGVLISKRDLMVRFKDEATVVAVNELIRGLPATVAGGDPRTGVLLLRLTGDSTAERVLMAQKSLLADPLVSTVAVNIAYEPMSLPGHHDTTHWNWQPEQLEDAGNWGLIATRMPQAWSLRDEALRNLTEAGIETIDVAVFEAPQREQVCNDCATQSGPLCTGAPTPDIDLDSQVGNPVATANTASSTDDWSSRCSSGGSARDTALCWTAPEAGTYAFSTRGSDFDTVLTVLDGATCDAPILACNDNYRGRVDSYVQVDVSDREFGHYRLSGSDQLHHLFAYSSPPGTSSSV